MAKGKYNHKRRIKGSQPAKLKAVYPGMMIRFKYNSENIFDKNPLVLVIWNDKSESKIHGINLNYLQESNIKAIMKKITKGADVYSEDKNIITEQDQDDSKYDDSLPYRNILREPYTRLKLPTYKETRGGNPLSQSEARVQMDLLYEKVIKKFMGRGEDYQVYRSYKFNKIQGIRVININLEKL